MRSTAQGAKRRLQQLNLPAATHQILTITSNQALETRTFARTDPHPNKAITVQRYHIFKGKAEHWMYT